MPVGGVAQVVESGVTGVVLVGRGIDEMANAVVALLADDERRTAMSAAGRSQIDRFSSAATAAIYSDQLGAFVATRGHRSER